MRLKQRGSGEVFYVKFLETQLPGFDIELLVSRNENMTPATVYFYDSLAKLNEHWVDENV